jgi:hypothetical protein
MNPMPEACLFSVFDAGNILRQLFLVIEISLA